MQQEGEERERQGKAIRGEGSARGDPFYTVGEKTL